MQLFFSNSHHVVELPRKGDDVSKLLLLYTEFRNGSGQKRRVEKKRAVFVCVNQIRHDIITKCSEHNKYTHCSCLECEGGLILTDKAVFVYLHKKMVLNDTPFMNKIRVNQFLLIGISF